MSGWIKLHRAIQENDLWTDEKFSRGQAWVDLLILANHTSTSFRVHGVLVDVERGEVARSQTALADRWKWSRTKVNDFLDELEKKEQLKIIRKDRILNKIRIINYDLYQNYEEEKQQTRQQTRQQKSIYNNDKNENNEKKYKKEVNTAYSEELERFWSVYPNKKKKPNTSKALEKALEKTTIDVIMSALVDYTKSQDWVKDNGQWIPHPTTWLNGEQWLDEIGKPTTQPTPPTKQLSEAEKLAKFEISKKKIEELNKQRQAEVFND